MDNNDVLLAEYIRRSEEDASAQATVISLTSIAIVIEGAIITLLRNYPSWFSSESYNPASQSADFLSPYIWMMLPAVLTGICGWILFQGQHGLVRRQYLACLESHLAENFGTAIKADVTDQFQSTLGSFRKSKVNTPIIAPAGTRIAQSITNGSARSYCALAVFWAGAFLFVALLAITQAACLSAAGRYLERFKDQRASNFLFMAGIFYAGAYIVVLLMIGRVALGSTHTWNKIVRSGNFGP